MFENEILQNQKKILDLKLIKRHFDVSEIIDVFELNKIVALIGSRRAWKTFLSFQIVKELIKRNILEIENIVFIDFSWILNKNILLEDIEKSYFLLFPDKKPFFIFDEIQELENFPEKLINFLNKWYKILITGSNAHLLSKEISTILRWKVYSKEIYPLSFKEFLDFKNIGYSKNELIINNPKIEFQFNNFLKWWGFPEIVLSENEIVKENILKSYLDIMIYKDLQDRYNIKNDYVLQFFIKRVLSTFSKELNINKIYNELKSNNIKVSKDSLYNFLKYLDDIYLISSLSNYWAQIKWIKKTYLIDVSFSNFVWNDDLWKRFENFVFLELKKKYVEIFFLNKNYEIDFFIPDKQEYIQVVYNLNHENLERETKYLSKQNWTKILIYFSLENDLIIPKNIKLIRYDEFIF